jgi:hypothetical protein
MARRFLSGVTMVAVAWSLGLALAAPDPVGVECTLPDGRSYRLAPTAPGASRYTLSHTPASDRRRIDLSMGPPTYRRAAHCDVASPCGQGRFSFRSANGGVIVEIDAAGARSAVDIFVSYELEVNVDVSLSPDIDVLNTHGRQAASCRLIDAP